MTLEEKQTELLEEADDWIGARDYHSWEATVNEVGSFNLVRGLKVHLEASTTKIQELEKLALENMSLGQALQAADKRIGELEELLTRA